MGSFTRVTPTNQNLFDLVDYSSKGHLALPQFQRSFVWSPSDVYELLVSVIKGYFIGSLLVMEIDPHDPPFAIRGVEGSIYEDENLSGIASRLLLDGQQRITSLHYAFYTPENSLKGKRIPTLFFIRLDALLNEDFDNVIFFQPANRTSERETIRGEYQYESLILPLPELLKWSEWSGAYSVWLATKDVNELQKWTLETKPNWDRAINNIFKFETSVLTLPKIEGNSNQQLEEICTVFEKLNSTGVRLSVFDLLTARLYPRGVYLDQLWQEAIEQSELFAKFASDKSTYGVLVLRCIALMRGVDLKSKALINLSSSNFNRDWRKAISYFEKAFERLTSTSDDGFGVFDEKWLPYTTTTPVLAALLAKRDSLSDHSKKGLATRAIQWWYWGAVLTERFTGPVETVTQKDYKDVGTFFEDQTQIPEIFNLVSSQILRDESEYELLSVSRPSTLYRAVMCLLALNGAKDFRTNESITYQSLQDHHIFPKGYLKDNYVKPTLGLNQTTLINSIVNRTLISDETNQAIKSQRPSDYLRDEMIFDSEMRDRILEKHFIHREAVEAMLQDQYELFLQQRQAMMLRKIKRSFDGMPRSVHRGQV